MMDRLLTTFNHLFLSAQEPLGVAFPALGEVSLPNPECAPMPLYTTQYLRISMYLYLL